MTSLIPTCSSSAWRNWIRITAWVLFLLTVLSVPAQYAAGSPTQTGPARQDSALLVETIIPNGAVDGAAAWGDIDNDGDQDLLVTGRGEDEAMTTLLLGNSDGSLALVGSAGLPRVESSTLALADFDRDGDLDVLITGQRGVTLSGELGLARVYRNEGGTSFSLYQELTEVYRGSAEWGDADQDGDLDILLTGYQNGGEGFSAIYRNDQGVFVINPAVELPGVGDSSVAWADYDSDGDLDFAILGKLSETSPDRVARVYQNQGSAGFTAITLTVNGLWYGSTTWLDVEGDGDLDLIVTGNNGPDTFNRDPLSLLFLTEPGGILIQAANTGLPDLWQSSFSAGDYDNDGDPDLLVSGQTADTLVTAVLNNTAGVFSDSGLVLAGGSGASVGWGHLDGDGSLDAMITGVEGPTARRSTYIYSGLAATPNTPPQAPALGTACWDGANSVIFTWNAGSDSQTPLNHLSYSLRVGSGPGLADIVAPSSAPDGYHQVPLPGPLTDGTHTVLQGLPDGEYTWSVQMVDSAYLGSPFAAEGRFLTGTQIARNDEIYVSSPEPVSIPVLQNDNPDYTDLVIYSVAKPVHGTTSIVNDQVVYTPDPGWAGTENIRYFALSPSTGHCTGASIIARVPGMYLEPVWVLEDKPVNTLVGVFTAAPPQNKPNETFTFHLYCNSCSNDNTAFWILEDKLKTARVFDYEVKNTYTIRVKALGSQGTLYVRDFVINILHVSLNPPTDILLSNATIQENISANAVLGELSCIDPDEGNYCKFRLVDGPGGEDNAFFSISGTELRTQAVFDYEQRSSYSILIRATDNTGQRLTKAFTISIANVSDSAPTGIEFSAPVLAEMQPPNSVLGEFTAIDSDPNDTFRFALVPGDGDADNTEFYLSGNRLINHYTLDYEDKNLYTIRVRATDQTERSVEQSILITLTDVEEQEIYFPAIINN